MINSFLQILSIGRPPSQKSYSYCKYFFKLLILRGLFFQNGSSPASSVVFFCLKSSMSRPIRV